MKSKLTTILILGLTLLTQAAQAKPLNLICMDSKGDYAFDLSTGQISSDSRTSEKLNYVITIELVEKQGDYLEEWQVFNPSEFTLTEIKGESERSASVWTFLNKKTNLSYECVKSNPVRTLPAVTRSN